MKTLTRIALGLMLLLTAHPAAAQTTTGAISGLITDSQNTPLSGVTVRARSATTGVLRTTSSDQGGVYRLGALPVGTYEITAERSGFRPFTAASIAVNLSRDVPLDIEMTVEGPGEKVVVKATAPLIPTRSSAVGEVIDLERIESLPLNGRQFANLAATVPGVGLSFHTDTTKGLLYTPQISGGNGRNISFLVDGGDNNDDTVGGQLQLFPLESIQEFTVLTQRFDAGYGRSSGGIINVVTKSGTNQRRGSWFTLLRDDGMNAKTFTESLAKVNKQPYERYQFGGSFGGPIVENRAHYFAAWERTHQEARQVVNTLGAFPDQDGVFPLASRENMFTVKATAALGANQHASIRYGRDRNSQPSGAGPSFAPSSWATSINSFDSLNVNHNWVLGSSLLNEAVIQYADFVNEIPATSSGPSFLLNGGVIRGGASALAPQRTEQIKWQFSNELSWTTTAGAGVSHELRGGVSWIHEPRLRVFSNTITNGLYTMATPSMTGPVLDVSIAGGALTANFPFEHYGLYVQDDWRVSDRVTLNLGVRWDYTRGLPIDQSGSTNFQAMQTAGRAGRFAGTILDEFGQEPRPDRDNVQPRIGVAIDLFGNGRDVIRGGWGLYTDFGYIASNVLQAALDATQVGLVFQVSDQSGIKKADGSFFQASDPLSTIAHLNTISGPVNAEVVSPLLEQPYTRQANLGWSHQLGTATVVSADYVRVDGRDLNLRLRPNVRTSPGGPRLLAGVPVQPASQNFRTVLSKGSSRYDALILSLRRHLSSGVDASASYTVSSATSDVGTASDEIVQNLIQDIADPFGPVQQGPSARTDSRHMVTISGIVQAPFGVDVAPIFHYRSALPVHTSEGIDFNGDGNTNDRTPVRYRYTGIGADNKATFVEDGTCETVNCSRRAGFSQFNLRISRTFPLARGLRIEAIGEVFNLFNAKNPVLAISQRRINAGGALNTSFMQPTAYAGDVGQTEQRVGQIGLRLTF